jgi:hypothetical protein
MTNTVKPSLRLWRVCVSKTIFIVSDNADALSGDEVHSMAQEDGASWSSRCREVADLGAVAEHDRKTNPHTDDHVVERISPTVEEFFKLRDVAIAEERKGKIGVHCAEGRLRIADEVHFKKVEDFAASIGKLSAFYDAILRLVGEGVYFGKPARVELFQDFAPASFDFTIAADGQIRMNGGLIFHGPHDGWGSGAAPSFSVSLSDSREARWETHT